MAKPKERMKRLREILEIVKKISKKGEAVSKEKLIARLGFEWGISRRTALEYIDTLVKGEYIIEEMEVGERILKAHNVPQEQSSEEEIPEVLR